MAEAKRSSSTGRTKKKKTKVTKGVTKEAVVETREIEKDQRVPEDGQTETVTATSEASEPIEPTGAENEKEKTVEPVRSRPSDEYLVQCYFDKSQNQFVATVLEFGHIRAVGTSKPDVIRDCENRLESHLNLLRRQGESLPETLQSRHYPETLQIPISQGLYRRLDLLSRQEKISLDQLVVELISGMVERRLQVSAKPQGQSHGPRPQQQGHQNHHRDSHRNHHRREGQRHEGQRHESPRHESQRHEPKREVRRENAEDFANEGDNIGNLKREPQQLLQNRNNRNRGGRNFHKTMESRENFLEYVRNLEKGSWKKR